MLPEDIFTTYDTEVAGVSFRQENVRLVKVGDYLDLVHDPLGAILIERFGDKRGHNDAHAVMLLHENRHVGYIPRTIAADYEKIARSGSAKAIVTAVVGGTEAKPTTGLRIVLPDPKTGILPKMLSERI